MAPAALDWYPGLMARTNRFLDGHAKRLDCFLELTDARAPASARWWGLGDLIGDKPRVLLLNKSDLADPHVTRAWQERFQLETPSVPALPLAAGGAGGGQARQRQGALLEAVHAAIHAATGRPPKASGPLLVAAVGIPNVGKSTVLNLLAGSRRAPAGARPGLTRGQQWLVASDRLWLLDLPGVLPPFIRRAGDVHRLALIGAAPDGAYDETEAACFLLGLLLGSDGAAVAGRLRLPDPLPQEATAKDVLEAYARRRGLLLPGAVPDARRAAAVLIAEFRRGALGRISLETPGAAGQPEEAG
jgi:ribosome biogenesis GTPase A